LPQASTVEWESISGVGALLTGCSTQRECNAQYQALRHPALIPIWLRLLTQHAWLRYQWAVRIDLTGRARAPSGLPIQGLV
jgi:hypothetical protein